MSDFLKDKNVIIISPSFFGYHSRIVEGLKTRGAQVSWYDDRPGNSFFLKALARLGRKFLGSLLTVNHRKVLEHVKVDYLLFIAPEAVSNKLLKKIKSKFLNIRLVLYLWDSIKNRNNLKKSFALFDRILSFDLEDSKEYGLVHRPLFYTKISDGNNHFRYQLCFIGTMHSDRFRIMEKINEKYSSLYSIFSYYYLQHKLVFVFLKLFSKNFKGATFDKFKYSSLKYEEYLAVQKDSRIIIDIEHPNQNGLTMRTIEMIGLKKKIITTNKSISKYDFYNPQNVYILSREKIEINDDFMNSPYKEIPDELYKKYSLDGWIEDVFHE